MRGLWGAVIIYQGSHAVANETIFSGSRNARQEWNLEASRAGRLSQWLHYVPERCGISIGAVNGDCSSVTKVQTFSLGNLDQ